MLLHVVLNLCIVNGEQLGCNYSGLAYGMLVCSVPLRKFCAKTEAIFAVAAASNPLARIVVRTSRVVPTFALYEIFGGSSVVPSTDFRVTLNSFWFVSLRAKFSERAMRVQCSTSNFDNREASNINSQPESRRTCNPLASAAASSSHSVGLSTGELGDVGVGRA